MSLLLFAWLHIPPRKRKQRLEIYILKVISSSKVHSCHVILWLKDKHYGKCDWWLWQTECLWLKFTEVTQRTLLLSVISLKASSLGEQFTCKVNVLFYIISEFLCRHNQETVLKASCQCFGITSQLSKWFGASWE